MRKTVLLFTVFLLCVSILFTGCVNKDLQKQDDAQELPSINNDPFTLPSDQETQSDHEVPIASEDAATQTPSETEQDHDTSSSVAETEEEPVEPDETVEEEHTEYIGPDQGVGSL